MGRPTWRNSARGVARSSGWFSFSALAMPRGRFQRGLRGGAGFGVCSELVFMAQGKSKHFCHSEACLSPRNLSAVLICRKEREIPRRNNCLGMTNEMSVRRSAIRKFKNLFKACATSPGWDFSSWKSWRKKAGDPWYRQGNPGRRLPRGVRPIGEVRGRDSPPLFEAAIIFLPARPTLCRDPRA
jgi:hypothetical protein